MIHLQHCGVFDEATQAPCTRSLTCKQHNLTARRQVKGRSKDFNIILTEHKALWHKIGRKWD
jgi:hypothetical protein